MILCGLAGAVRDGFAVGDAWSVGAVVGDGGQRSTPSLASSGGPTVSCPARALTTPEAKRAWADSTDADLVDLESAAFARIAMERGWAWGIVRGVSDGPDATLPADIDTWVDGRGRSRPGRVIRALLTGRAGVGQLRRLRSGGAAAMASAAAVLERMLER